MFAAAVKVIENRFLALYAYASVAATTPYVLIQESLANAKVNARQIV